MKWDCGNKISEQKRGRQGGERRNGQGRGTEGHPETRGGDGERR